MVERREREHTPGIKPRQEKNIFAGNREAEVRFNGIVQDYHKAIFRYVHKLTQDIDLSLDITQTTFEKVMHRLVEGHRIPTPDDRDESSPSRNPELSYLFTMAKHALVDHHRAKKAKNQVKVTLVPDYEDYTQVPSSDVQDAPEAQSVSMDTRQKVWDLITPGYMELSVEHQEVIYYTHEQEMSQPEIAKLLGIPLGTVKSRLHYAHNHLRKWIEESGTVIKFK